jgi:hypothetical protein
MSQMKKILMLVVASAAISGTAAAQDTRSDNVACLDTTAAAGMYRRCALWMEGNKVHRGEEGTVVTRQGFFVPPHLTRFVAGDSARAYANKFERRSKQSIALFVLGGIFTGLSVAQARCGGQYSGCAYDYGFDSPGFNMLLAGGVMAAVGGGLQVSAAKAGHRAVWWNNARFAR